MQRKYRSDPLAYLPTERRAWIYKIINTVSKHLDWADFLKFFLNNIWQHHRILSLWEGEDPKATHQGCYARWDLVSLLAPGCHTMGWPWAAHIPHAKNRGAQWITSLMPEWAFHIAGTSNCPNPANTLIKTWSIKHRDFLPLQHSVICSYATLVGPGFQPMFPCISK